MVHIRTTAIQKVISARIVFMFEDIHIGDLKVMFQSTIYLFILPLRLLKCARFEVLTAVLKIHIFITEVVSRMRT